MKYPNIINLILFIIFSFYPLVSSAEVQNNSFTRLFIFGDSLSDTGNTSKLFSGLFPKIPPYFKGRLSNGPVWVEHFSQTMNISSEQVFNFAFAGARANQGRFPVPSLDKQVSKYIKWNKNGADPNALYIIWIGANDLINDEDKKNDFQVVSKTSNQIKNQIKVLIHHGAKHFLIPNLPAISLSPFAFEKDAKQKNTKFSEHIGIMTTHYNSLLQQNLNNLTIEYPDVKFIRFDAYLTLKNIMDYASAFGFSNVNQRCNPNGYLNDHLAICNFPDEYLFWDTVHPSAAGHKLLSDFIISTLQYNGYLPKETIDSVNNQDMRLYSNNKKAIQELTSSKLDITKYESMLLYDPLF